MQLAYGVYHNAITGSESERNLLLPVPPCWRDAWNPLIQQRTDMVIVRFDLPLDVAVRFIRWFMTTVR
ncbi:hypothetical protein [Mycobacterium uberis]|uniref:hypothetical protein n=1 Tax=Mycobacterium uberis TaxID=2162698 RepID=UPI000E301421